MEDDLTDSTRRTRNFELPSSYGAHIWNFLAQFGRCWTQKEQWLSATSYVTDCLHPQQSGNHGSGCERCYNHWMRLTKIAPPEKVNNSMEAAVWVHFIHNQVNNVATPQKPAIPYNQAARTPGYGWALLKDDEYFAILEKFGIKLVRKSAVAQAKRKGVDKPK